MRRPRSPTALGAAVVAGALLVAGPAGSDAASRASPSCAPLALERGYVERVNAALRSRLDVQGNELLSRPEGPTFSNVKGLLTPLLLVGSPAGRSGTRLTDSGVYYLAFGEPGGRSFGSTRSVPFALHVADGSQIASRSANGRRMTVYVGRRNDERFGSCLSRLGTPSLAGGYLPILVVRFTDDAGAVWEQESFVGKTPAGVLASFVRIRPLAAGSDGSARARLTVTDPNPVSVGRTLRSGGRIILAFSPGGRFEPSTGLEYTLAAGGESSAIHLVRPIDPARRAPVASSSTFASARAGTIRAWRRRLAEGAVVDVPERIVANALRALLIQNLQLSWRYSAGNAYETFYQPESSAAVLRLAEYGFLRDARDGLQALLPRSRGRSTNWERGEKMAAAAAYYLLSGDRAFLTRNDETYARYATELATERATNPDGTGLLYSQRYSGDIVTKVYGLHHQSRAWRGLRDIAYVWGLTGRVERTNRFSDEARSFGASLLRAISRSSVRVSPAETFVPVELLASPPRRPWDPITGTRLGSYWNLVSPYGWASGILPESTARGVLGYARRHGSYFLGLVRFDYYPTRVGAVTCDGLPGYRTSGSNGAYGVHHAHFLADRDRPNLLVLSLYARLAHGMTRGTFVSGEGETVGPVPPGACRSLPDGEYFRSMYLPPSSASSDAFLATLRESLVHWSTGDDGRPQRLQLAYSTPRAWLAHGKRVAVRGVPTPFGRLGYAIESHVDDGFVDVEVRIPSRRRIDDLSVRVRLPRGYALRAATIGRRSLRPVGEAFDLTGRTGTVRLRIAVSG